MVKRVIINIFFQLSSPTQNQPTGHDSSNVASSIIEAATTSSGASNINYGHIGAEKLIKILGYEGILVNKDEIEKFHGPIPLDQYPINEDPNPLIIQKTCDKEHHVNQEVSIRYLEPPPLPRPGDLVIQHEVDYI